MFPASTVAICAYVASADLWIWNFITVNKYRFGLSVSTRPLSSSGSMLQAFPNKAGRTKRPRAHGSLQFDPPVVVASTITLNVTISLKSILEHQKTDCCGPDFPLLSIRLPPFTVVGDGRSLVRGDPGITGLREDDHLHQRRLLWTL
jgi:hypothetical protein